MSKSKFIDCGYAAVDVKNGRRRLRRRLLDGETVRVVLVGTLDQHPSAMSEDAESIEFVVNVESCIELDGCSYDPV